MLGTDVGSIERARAIGDSIRNLNTTVPEHPLPPQIDQTSQVDQAEEEKFVELLAFLTSWTAVRRDVPAERAEHFLLRGSSIIKEELKLAFYAHALNGPDSIEEAPAAPPADTPMIRSELNNRINFIRFERS